MSKKLVLVTGVNGFLAAHVALQLIKSGYLVRGTVRGARMQELRVLLGDHYPELELAQLDDIATSDLTDALKGVSAVIHVASPLLDQSSPQETLNGAVEGALNVLRQTFKAGINKIVLTSSWGTTLTPGKNQSFTPIVTNSKVWGQATEEDLLNGKYTPFETYLASKILSEAAAWKFAEENPSLDLATINPPFVYGPRAPHFPIPSPSSLGTTGFLYNILTGKTPPPLPPHFSDVRDAALAHVRALDVPPQKPVQAKRFLICGGTFTFKQAAEHLATARPGMKDRLAPIETFPKIPSEVAVIDDTPAKELLGITSFVDWKVSVEQTADDLLKFETRWKKAA